MGKYNKIVLNIPHSSIHKYSEGWVGYVNMFPTVKKWTDWHTDILFPDTSNNKVISAIYPYSRFYCDVERLVDDPLNAEGRGIIYKKFDGFTRKVDDVLNLECAMSYSNWINHLNELIEDEDIVLDCHTFSSDLSDTDICIGFNEDWSKPSDEIINGVADIFREQGYKVSFNTPYSNSITPKKGRGYHSLMIEVNKKIFMNEDTLETYNNFFYKLKRTISKVYDYLLE